MNYHDPKTLREIELFSRELCINKKAFDWMLSASEDGWTDKWNKEIFKTIALIPRILNDVSTIDIRSNFLKLKSLELPVIVSPLGHLTQFHEDGEIELAMGMQNVDTLLCISTQTRIKLSEIKRSAPKSRLMWQVYFYGDRSWVLNQVNEAIDLGVEAICVCVDAPIRPVRYLDREIRYDARHFGRRTQEPVQSMLQNSKTTWADIEWLKSSIKKPLILKGILAPEDALIAKKMGIDAVWVSNHGGRQLNSGLSPLEVIRDIRIIVGEDFPLILDGGIRSGSDVVKAIALGSNIVGIGRTALFGLIHSGSSGVNLTFNYLREEIIACMAMCGINKVDNIKKLNLKIRSK